MASSLAKTTQQSPISSNVPRWRLEIQDHVDNTRLANSLKKIPNGSQKDKHYFYLQLCKSNLINDFQYFRIKYCNLVSFSSLSVERGTGVEPAFQAWEARALPMC